MHVQVFDTRKEMGDAAGKAVEDKILEIANNQDEVRMIFAAAPSQNELLAYLRQASGIPWHKITAFHMDEYIGLPADAPQLFANFLKRNLFDHVDLQKAHFIDGSQGSEAECRRYGSLLAEAPIDIVCLGIGENGHIAFNDPPVADFNDTERIKPVALDHECRQQQVNDGCFQALDQVPRQALTLTIPALMRGKHLYGVVPGASKREAVLKTLTHPVTTACPATVLREHPHCELYLDTASYTSGKKLQ